MVNIQRFSSLLTTHSTLQHEPHSHTSDRGCNSRCWFTHHKHHSVSYPQYFFAQQLTYTCTTKKAVWQIDRFYSLQFSWICHVCLSRFIIQNKDGDRCHCGRWGGGCWGGLCWKSWGFCWGGEGGDPGLELMKDVSGDGVRSASSSFKSTVELIQLIGQPQVIYEVEGCRFIVYLPEPTPDRSRRVIGWELILEFLRVLAFSFSHHIAKPVLWL